MALSQLVSLSISPPVNNLRSCLFIFVLSMTRPELSQQRIKTYVLRLTLPLLSHLPPCCMPTLILLQRLPCYHSNLPDTVLSRAFALGSCGSEMPLPRYRQNLLLHLSQMLSPKGGILFPLSSLHAA